MFLGLIGPNNNTTFFTGATRNQFNGLFDFRNPNDKSLVPVTENYFSLIKFVQPGLTEYQINI